MIRAMTLAGGQPSRFPLELHSRLESYVYLYTDPRNGEPFYVGKGRGDRAFAHLRETGEKEKRLRIEAIHASGQQPQIDVLCYGLSEVNAALVEAAAIALLGRPPLLNLVGGDFTVGYGRISANELIRIAQAEPVVVKENAILIRINRLYRSNMNPHELYEATRGIWKLGLRRNKAEYALAVYQGIVLEVYRIGRWLPAGSSIYKTRLQDQLKVKGRWEFEGAVDTWNSPVATRERASGNIFRSTASSPRFTRVASIPTLAFRHFDALVWRIYGHEEHCCGLSRSRALQAGTHFLSRKCPAHIFRNDDKML